MSARIRFDSHEKRERKSLSTISSVRRTTGVSHEAGREEGFGALQRRLVFSVCIQRRNLD